jgi:uncharacterized protein YcfJ
MVLDLISPGFLCFWGTLRQLYSLITTLLSSPSRYEALKQTYKLAYLEISMKIHVIAGIAGLALLSIHGSIFAQEQGRVISTTPVVSQVAVPRQVCSQEQVVSQAQQKSGAGALMGGVAGGVVGNSMGQGNGRAAATLIGIFGGAILGDKLEGGQQVATQNVQRCSTQTFYENRATAYNVVYEFNGKQYQVQLPQDPGPFVSLQVTPVGSATQPATPVAAPVITRPVTQLPAFTQHAVIETSTVYVQQPQIVYLRPQPVYAPTPIYIAPAYYEQPRRHYPHGHPYRPHGNGNGNWNSNGTNISIGYSGHFR